MSQQWDHRAAVAKPVPRGRRASAEETRQEIIAALVGLLEIANRGRFVILQVMTARSAPNSRLKSVGPLLLRDIKTGKVDVAEAGWAAILADEPVVVDYGEIHPSAKGMIHTHNHHYPSGEMHEDAVPPLLAEMERLGLADGAAG